MRSLIVLLVVGLILALSPAAQASPPDQTWIPGFYDNADYDDVVRAVTASVASLEHSLPRELGFIHLVVAFVLPPDERPNQTPLRSSNHTRPPPAA